MAYFMYLHTPLEVALRKRVLITVQLIYWWFRGLYKKKSFFFKINRASLIFLVHGHSNNKKKRIDLRFLIYAKLFHENFDLIQIWDVIFVKNLFKNLNVCSWRQNIFKSCLKHNVTALWSIVNIWKSYFLHFIALFSRPLTHDFFFLYFCRF